MFFVGSSFQPPTKHESSSSGKFHVSSHNRETAAKLICSWEIKQQITCEGPILPLPRLLINKEGTRKGVMVVSGISAICFWQKTLCESHFYFTQVNKYRVPFTKTKQYLVNFVCKGSNQILSKHHSHHSKN